MEVFNSEIEGCDAGKSDPARRSRKQVRVGLKRPTPPRIKSNKGLRSLYGPQLPQVGAGQEEDASWTLINGKKRKKKLEEQERSDGYHAKESKEGRCQAVHVQVPVLGSFVGVGNDTKLVDHGTGVRSIKCTRTGEMILENSARCKWPHRDHVL